MGEYRYVSPWDIAIELEATADKRDGNAYPNLDQAFRALAKY
jgi:hypothetical protein